MRDTVAHKDVYNKNGVLLIAKGQKITKEIEQKLQSMHISDYMMPATLNEKIKVNDCARTLAKKINTSSRPSMEKSSKIMNDIIFGSKSDPWWVFICALSNYIAWIYTHSINVALISTIMAQKLHYSEEKQKRICLGALLHDIGKLVLPKKVLQKPGELNARETSIMQQHCELGYDMVAKLNLPQDCASIIIQHHERLDGSGYPNQIHTEQISAFAKIVMIADTFDAITSYRPYRGAGNVQDAVKVLLKEQSKFDPENVRVLLNYLDAHV